MTRDMIHFLMTAIVCFFLIGLTQGSQAQPLELTWASLKDVSFESAYDKNADTYYQKPTFGPDILALEGSEIAITGYVIPVDINLNYYVLSAFPFASCFFCGGAGPESVMDLQLKKERTFKNDERIRFCGTLKLNKTDFYALPFLLEGATPCSD